MTTPEETKGLLRFLTAGSVDDGKSTLIGRLLYDADAVYEDQIESLRKIAEKSDGVLDLSLITDGLKAEREQAITIDVAYRYFSTGKRHFIIADTPGHEQYTRNMVTGASTAHLAVLLVDARKGLLEQTRRHAYVVWLLGIRHIVLAINKMDLVRYDPGPFENIRDAFYDATASMKSLATYCVPVSALTGENVITRSQAMAWYAGPTLLDLLENIPLDSASAAGDFRFPVQSVVRAESDFRGYAGQIVAGSAKPGQTVTALPSGRRTTIDKIILYKKALAEATASQSVLITLTDNIDLGRGDVLVGANTMPLVGNRFIADLIWMSERPLKTSVPYLVKHTTQVLCGNIRQVVHRLDVQNFTHLEAQTLRLNEIGQVEIETHKAMSIDPYSVNRAMGSFIMIDPATNDTVAAGLFSRPPFAGQETLPAGTIAELATRAANGLTVWFTGLSGAGKSTICTNVCTELLGRGFKVEVLDGDIIRKELNSDLGFTRRDRDENVRRLGFVAQLLSRHGVIVLVAAISPYRVVRDELRESIPNFIEVYVNAPLGVCEQRDPKGLYKRARNRQIEGFTGIDDPYQPPLRPHLECRTDQESVKASTDKVVSAVLEFLNSGASCREFSASDRTRLFYNQDMP